MSFLVAFFASVAGGICGIGGGIIIKPLIDLFSIASISTASFLSSATVLAMAAYNSARNLSSELGAIRVNTMLPLAVGAAVGGVSGNLVFNMAIKLLPNSQCVGAVQAILLALIALGTMLYTLNKKHIKTTNVQSKTVSCGIGLSLGVISSFLGIGGGPLNLPVLQYFFSMDTRSATQSSLFIILISQLFSLIYMILSRNIPEFQWGTLFMMIGGGVIGGIVGKTVSKNISNSATDKLFIMLLICIISICIYNFTAYTK